MQSAIFETPQQKALIILGLWKKNLEERFCEMLNSQAYFQNLFVIILGGWIFLLIINLKKERIRKKIQFLELAEEELKLNQIANAFVALEKLQTELIADSLFIITATNFIIFENQNLEEIESIKQRILHLSTR